jgi:hypothetical protein
MKAIQKITVSIRFDSSEIEVGELIRDGREIYFFYSIASKKINPIFS